MSLTGLPGPLLTGRLNYGKVEFTMKSFRIITLMLAVVFINAKADAQLCCTTGSASASSFEIGVTPAKTLRLSFGHEYNSLNGTFAGSDRSDVDLLGTGSVQSYTFQAHYGINRRWGFTLAAPYVKTSRSFGGPITFGADGIGDISLIAKYSLKPINIASSTEIAAGAGFKLPSGSANSVDDGTDLNFNLQPGTGAWDLLLWGYYYKTSLPTGWSGSLSGLVRMPGTNSDGLQYGNEILYSLVLNKRLSTTTQLSVRLKGRTSSQVTISGFENPNTGGTIVFAAPSFVYNPQRLISIEAGVDIPTFYNVSGTQQALDYRTFVDFSLFFTL